MSEVYKIYCIILNGATYFSVKIGKDEDVDNLKHHIKEKSPELNVARKWLSLYKIDVDASNQQHAIDKVKKLAPTLSTADSLNPMRKMSEVFPSGVPDGKIHILVKLTDCESIDSRASGILLMAGDIDAAWTQFNSRPPQLSGYRTRHWSTSKSSLLTNLTAK